MTFTSFVFMMILLFGLIPLCLAYVANKHSSKGQLLVAWHNEL